MAFTIVVGYDGSDGAKVALDEAVDLARQLSGKIFVTYAYRGPNNYSGAPLDPDDTLEDLVERLLERARILGEKLLGQALARSGGDVQIEPVLIEARPAQGLLTVARQQRAKIIVVGTHGESPIGAMVLGSTAYQLVHSTNKPVLVVPTAKQRRKAS
jgi:nucleotide-binding universal stress UspA family protein